MYTSKPQNTNYIVIILYPSLSLSPTHPPTHTHTYIHTRVLRGNVTTRAIRENRIEIICCGIVCRHVQTVIWSHLTLLRGLEEERWSSGSRPHGHRLVFGTTGLYHRVRSRLHPDSALYFLLDYLEHRTQRLVARLQSIFEPRNTI